MMKIKLGIEKTMVGFFYLASIIFICMGFGKIRISDINDMLLRTRSDIFPYIAILLVGFAYLLGNIADRLSYTIMLILWRCIKPLFFKNKFSKKAKWLKSFGEVDDANKYVYFLQSASLELAQEYNSKLGQNILFRVLAFAMPLLGLTSIYWLISIKEKIAYIVIIAIITLIFALVFFVSYMEQRKEYFQFRESAYREFNK